jgi:hypothetical protein
MATESVESDAAASPAPLDVRIAALAVIDRMVLGARCLNCKEDAMEHRCPGEALGR